MEKRYRTFRDATRIESLLTQTLGKRVGLLITAPRLAALFHGELYVEAGRWHVICRLTRQTATFGAEWIDYVQEGEHGSVIICVCVQRQEKQGENVKSATDNKQP